MKNAQMPSALRNEQVRKMQFALANSQNLGNGFWVAVILNLFLSLRDLSTRIPVFKITLRVDEEIEEPEAPLGSLNPNHPLNQHNNVLVWWEVLLWLSSQEEDIENILEKMDEILEMVYNEEIPPHMIILEERQAAKPGAPPVVTQPRPAPARPAAPVLAPTPPKAPSTSSTPAANPLEKLSQKVAEAEDEVDEGVSSVIEQGLEAVKQPAKPLTPKQERRAKRHAEAEAEAQAKAEAEAEAEAKAEAEAEATEKGSGARRKISQGGKKEAINAKRRARTAKKAAQAADN